ncbi:MAG: hypothetical protein ABIG71_01165 [Candidatus Uhrbacteria bacterium]
MSRQEASPEHIKALAWAKQVVLTSTSLDPDLFERIRRLDYDIGSLAHLSCIVRMVDEGGITEDGTVTLFGDVEHASISGEHTDKQRILSISIDPDYTFPKMQSNDVPPLVVMVYREEDGDRAHWRPNTHKWFGVEVKQDQHFGIQLQFSYR